MVCRCRHAFKAVKKAELPWTESNHTCMFCAVHMYMYVPVHSSTVHCNSSHLHMPSLPLHWSCRRRSLQCTAHLMRTQEHLYHAARGREGRELHSGAYKLLKVVKECSTTWISVRFWIVFSAFRKRTFRCIPTVIALSCVCRWKSLHLSC